MRLSSRQTGFAEWGVPVLWLADALRARTERARQATPA
jgi:hypothetical protein